MRFAVVMDDLREVFTGHVEVVRDVVIAAGEDDFAGGIAAIFSANGKVAVGAVETENALVLMDVELVVIGYAAVVLERFGAAGLLVERGHRNVADFEQLRRGEEDQIDGVVVNRVDHATLVEQHWMEAALLQLN